MFSLTAYEDVENELKMLEKYRSTNNMLVSVPFYGAICGDFFLSVDEAQWTKVFKSSLNSNDEEMMLSSLREFFQIVANRTLTHMKKDFPDLRCSMPRISRGKYDCPLGSIVSRQIKCDGLSNLEVLMNWELMGESTSDKLDVVLKKVKRSSVRKSDHGTHQGLHRLLPQILQALNNKIFNCVEQVEPLYKDCTPEKLDGLHDSIAYVQGPIGDLYDWLSSLETGSCMFKVKELVLKSLNESLAYTTQDVHIDIKKPPREYIFAPQKALEFIMENLIRNSFEALSTIEDPKLKISFFYEVAYFGIIVEDNGPGVPPESQETIWEPFATNKKQNSGLGLSICRDIMEMYGGDLLYSDSTLGGASFTVMLRNDAQETK